MIKKILLLCCLSFSAICVPQFAGAVGDYFISGELLGRPAAMSISLEVVPAVSMQLSVEYGKKPGKYTKTTKVLSAKPGETVELVVDHLKQNKQYYFRLRYKPAGSDSFLVGEERTFHTQRKAKDQFTFDVIADPHLSRETTISGCRQTLQNIADDEPDFLIDLGDTFMTDELGSYDEQTIAARMLDVRDLYGEVCHSLPLFLVLGNHCGEIGFSGPPGRQELAANAVKVRTQYFPNPRPDGFYTGNTQQESGIGYRENYYAWTWGNALFVVLDAQHYNSANPMRMGDNWDRSLGAEQYNWLVQTLKYSTAGFKLVFIHNLVGGSDTYARGGAEAVPYYEWGGTNADGSFGFDDERPGWGLPIHELFRKYGVTIVFHGHDHSYTRQEKDGIVYQLVPQPSESRKYDDAEALHYGYASGVILDGAGHLRVTVKQTSITIEFVQSDLITGSKSSNGTVAQSYTISR